MRLVLPAASAYAEAPGRTWVRLDTDWGNDFGWRRRRVGSTTETRLLVDGEHQSVAIEARRSLSSGWTVGARLPLRWRGGGVLDGVIDWWHDLTGLPGGGRSLLPRGGFTVEGIGPAGRLVGWSGQPGAGLGRLELGARWSPRAREDGWAAGLDLRAALPTATGVFPAAGLDVGAQVLASFPLGEHGDLYAGAGGTVVTQRQVEGLVGPRARGQAFAAVEWRPARRLSLLGEVSMATRLVDTLTAMPALPAYLRLGAKLDLGSRWRVEGGFVEGVHGLFGTTDFGVMAGVARRFGTAETAPAGP